ncbi:Major facilitator superfamily domain, general substrate transporter [Cordyceps fumosorosea ARSEF 2679]|uniref:Autophagy-related protein n=1 Tax=Cordyceps fumosorosea (strain ARSEF 2679) TaxID=1081104 RepID=A0A167MYR7_CORFA|nr:Major facilitator superfamily domain, general substrate transporter [Cordyceps fumosorosea ARSEF 2679]OAA54918.1 Major facilitator superfamily domain, general substrate transporter [Cordyceps fumosorosea ARSEF 2679]
MDPAARHPEEKTTTMTKKPVDETSLSAQHVSPSASDAGGREDGKPPIGIAASDELRGSVSAEQPGLVMPALTDTAQIPMTTTAEIWSWYTYYIGANGLALFNFGPTAFQNLLSQAAGGDDGLLHFAGADRDVNSIVLLANGISFALQAVLFLAIGAWADFGAAGRRGVLLVWSLVAYAVGFAWLALTLTYWTAAFPSLARNTRWIRDSREALATGEISLPEMDRRDEMERSRLSNVAFYVQSVAEIAILAVIVGIMYAVHVRRSVEDNNWGLSVLIAFATGVWLLLSLPWFVVEKTRPGMRIPAGLNIVTVGFWQLREAAVQIWQLRQSLIFLAGYFLLGDSLNTTVTVIATLQNQVIAYDTLKLTYLLIVGIAAQAVGIGLFWLVQKRMRLGAKTMFNAVMVSILLLDGWGMVGNWTGRFGFKNEWEIWLYQAFYGLAVCPWYSYSQIMISSVTPRGHEFLFFSVFNIIGKASSFIGPLISSRIIDATPGGTNNSAPFYFLFGLSLLSAVGLWAFLDLEKSAREQEVFLAKEKAKMGDDGSDVTTA